MSEYFKLELDWFGEGGDGGAAASATGTGESGQGESAETAAVPSAPTRRSKNDAYANVLFGKQAISPEETDAGASVGTKGEGTPEETPEDRQKAYQDLVRGKYKDLFAADTQRIINQRFKESKTQQETIAKQGEILDMLMSRYNAKDLDGLKSAIDNDDSMWENAADDAGMTVKQYKEFARIQRENNEFRARQQELETQRKADEIMQRWNAEAEALKQKFPQFDLNVESQNPQFTNMLQHGVPVEVAYKALHLDDIVTEAMKTTAQVAEKRVVDNVRAKGSRPVENGLSSTSTFTVKSDVSKLNKADRAEIARRAMRGEQISF